MPSDKDQYGFNKYRLKCQSKESLGNISLEFALKIWQELFEANMGTEHLADDVITRLAKPGAMKKASSQ